MIKTTSALIGITLVAAMTALLPMSVNAGSATTVLYDGALRTGDIPPERQGWLSFAGKADLQGSKDNVTHLVTNRIAPAGYTNYQFLQPALVNPAFPQLDRSKGFTIQFDLQLNAENHDNSDRNGDGIGDRAGFSMIAISNDKKGVELGFWKDDSNPRMRDRIWIQQDGAAPPPQGKLFTHTAEGAEFNTGVMTHYELKIQGNRYQLFANRFSTPILSGLLRDYRAFDYQAATPPLLYSPYATPNFLFFGDDTGSASADITLKYIAVDTTPVSLH
jgi:hypothetical protein